MFGSNDDDEENDDFFGSDSYKDEVDNALNALNAELRIEFYNEFKNNEEFREDFLNDENIPTQLKLKIFNDLLDWKEKDEAYEECAFIKSFKLVVVQ